MVRQFLAQLDRRSSESTLWLPPSARRSSLVLATALWPGSVSLQATPADVWPSRLSLGGSSRHLVPELLGAQPVGVRVPAVNPLRITKGGCQ